MCSKLGVSEHRGTLFGVPLRVVSSIWGKEGVPIEPPRLGCAGFALEGVGAEQKSRVQGLGFRV